MMWTPSSSRSGKSRRPRCCGASSAAGWRAAAPSSWSSGSRNSRSSHRISRSRHVERAHIDLYTSWKRTRTRAPQAVVSTPIRLQPFQVTRTSGPARTGHRCRDACRRPPVRPAGLPWARARRGFGPRHVPVDRAAGVPHAAGGGGRHARRRGSPARPAPPRPRSRCGSGSGWSESGCSERPHRRSGWTGRRPETQGPIDLTIQSTVFNPRSLGLSSDPRDLGVRLYRVAVELPPERPAP